MAVNLLTYSGIITKTKALSAKLLSDSDYNNISEIKTVNDFIIYLRNSQGYKNIYREHDEVSNRTHVESFLYNSLYNDFAKLYKFSNCNQKQALDILFIKYECEYISFCLKNALFGKNEFNISIPNSFIIQHSRLNQAELMNAHNINEFVMAFKGSEYYHLFNVLKNTSHETLRDYLVPLNIYMYKKIWKSINKLKNKKDKQVLMDYFGTEIDCKNIMWIYRSKKFFKLSKNDIYVSIIPIHYKIDKNDFIDMIEAEGVEELLDIIKKTTYFKNKATVFDSGFNESLIIDILSDVLADNVRKYPVSVSLLLSYFHNKRLEIVRLQTALECIKYKLSPPEVLKNIYESV